MRLHEFLTEVALDKINRRRFSKGVSVLVAGFITGLAKAGEDF